MLGVALSACLGETCCASLDELVDAFGRVLGGGEERGKLRGRMAVAPELLEPLVSDLQAQEKARARRTMK